MRTQNSNRQACQNTSKVWRLNAIAGAMAVAIGGFSASAFAAAPAANSLIGNTATASYTDASAVNRTATSNTVQTVVQQVGSFTLTADNTRIVAPGGQVVYPHTLTNTGNGGDTFTLAAAQALTGTVVGGASDNFDFTPGSFAIYADADGNGVPDNAVNLIGSTVTLASNDVFKFVVVGNAPGTTIAGDDVVSTVTVTNSAPNTVTNSRTNTDVATVTADAVINVTKSANILTGPTGTVVEYTLTYTNTGNNTARDVTISDALPQGVSTFGGMVYQANSAVWSAGGALTDAAGGDPAGITYEVTGTYPALQTVNVVIASVAPNVSGTIKFQVQVDNSTADGNLKAAPGILTNTANFFYDPDNNAGTNNNTTSQPTNSVDFDVIQTSAVAANDSETISAIGGDDDIVEVASAGQGATVEFENIIWNNGNGADSFNVTYANMGAGMGFPVGTSFQLFQTDGNNVLQDTNSDGVPNTPTIQPGQFYKVILKATLPTGATGNNSGNGFTVVKTATSITDPSKNDTVNDKLNAIASNVVDLSNNVAIGYADGTLGGGTATTAGTVDNGGAAWSTNSINPGSSTTFTLLVENKVGIADNYNLAAGSTAGMAALPSGWTVVFRENGGGNCATLGATITNTGTINAGGNKLVCAVVAVPSTQAPIDQDVYFRVTSPVSNAVDTKLDEVVVQTYRNLQMITDRTGQVFPNGSVVYEHIITNNGNVTEGDNAGEFVLGATNSLAGFTTVLYLDLNNDGVLDASDPSITNIGANDFAVLSGTTTGYTGTGANAAGLAIGESIRIFAKVQAPAGATPGTTDTATITVDVVGTVNTVAAPTDPVNTDTTNVIGGQIRLDKTQALDKNCDGDSADVGEQAYTTANINALPGECIMYRIIATNEGVSPVTTITINDTTPAFTSLSVGPAPAIVTSGAGAVATTGISTDGATGALGATISTLSGAQTATFTFSVKIDQ